MLYISRLGSIYDNLKKSRIVWNTLPYVSLGILTFLFVVTTAHTQIGFQKQYHAKKTVLAKAIINSQTLTNSSVPASPSAASMQAEITPTPIPAQPSDPATPSADFCLQVPVLMYHHVQMLDVAQVRGQLSLTVDTTVFDQQMQYLVSHGYHTISAETLVTALRNHTFLPANAIVITLDDAYEDAYTDAFPIAKKYHVLLNLMVPTGLLGVHEATNYYFTWDQLREMVNSGLAVAYDHTWSHYPMGTGSADKNQFEVMTAKQQLEQNLGKQVTIFTYPYGAGYDSSWVTELLKKDGFAGAYSTIGGTIQCESFIMALHRTRIGSDYFPAFGVN